MINRYKRIIRNNKIVNIVLVIFLVGLVIGSFYITLLKNSEKELIINSVNNYFSNNTISFDEKISIFKSSFISNFIYFTIMWLIGISIIGLPILYIMVIVRSFNLGFTISSIFAAKKIGGILDIILYLIPNNLVLSILTIFLASYSSIISIHILRSVISKKTLNFNSFMGKYFFVYLISFIIIVLNALYDAFIYTMIK